MLLTEYNETKTMELFKEEGRAEGRKEGRAEGRTEGRSQLGRLIARLLSLGRIADVERAATDDAYCDQLIEEFDIH